MRLINQERFVLPPAWLLRNCCFDQSQWWLPSIMPSPCLLCSSPLLAPPLRWGMVNEVIRFFSLLTFPPSIPPSSPPSLHCQQLWPSPVSACGRCWGWRTPVSADGALPLPAVTLAFSCQKVWRGPAACGHERLMKRRNRWSGEWWRKWEAQTTGGRNEAVTFMLWRGSGGGWCQMQWGEGGGVIDKRDEAVCSSSGGGGGRSSRASKHPVGLINWVFKTNAGQNYLISAPN